MDIDAVWESILAAIRDGDNEEVDYLRGELRAAMQRGMPAPKAWENGTPISMVTP